MIETTTFSVNYLLQIFSIYFTQCMLLDPIIFVRCFFVLIMLTLRCAGGREFEPRPGQYSRMSYSPDQVTGTVFSNLNMPLLPNSKFI